LPDTVQAVTYSEPVLKMAASGDVLPAKVELTRVAVAELPSLSMALPVVLA
jgi:hypothetical protein